MRQLKAEESVDRRLSPRYQTEIMSVQKSKTVFLIQVRMNSSRLPGKAMIRIAGRPLISILTDHLSPLSDIGRIAIATTNNDSDDSLAKFASSNGIPCFRGEEEDALTRFIGAATQFNSEIIVRITGDNPLTDPENIKVALTCLKEEERDYVGIVGLPLGTSAEVCTLSALKKADKMTRASIHRETITSYLYTNPDKFNIRILDRSDQIYSRPSYRLTIDTEEDLRLMEQIYQILGDRPTLTEVVSLLDSRPDLVAINAKVEQRTI